MRTPFDIQRCAIDPMLKSMSTHVGNYRAEVIAEYLERVTNEPLIMNDGTPNPKIEGYQIHHNKSFESLSSCTIEYWFCEKDVKKRICTIEEHIEINPQYLPNKEFRIFGEIKYKVF